MKTTFIYALKDPRTDDIRYIGKSNYPARRLGEHIAGNSNKAKSVWIGELVDAGLKPKLVNLEEVPRDEWREREMHWIAEGHKQGWPLVNISQGGDGSTDADYDCLRSYLGGCWNDFDRLDEATKRLIVITVAREMVPYSSIAAKAAGEEYHDGMAFSMGKFVARQLVRSVSDREWFDEQVQIAADYSAQTMAKIDGWMTEHWG